MVPHTNVSSDGSEGSGDREIARVVEQYFDPEESVSETELQRQLQTAVRGTIVELEPKAVGITVIVEQSREGGERSRDCYLVRRMNTLSGEPALDWSYLGPAE